MNKKYGTILGKKNGQFDVRSSKAAQFVETRGREAMPPAEKHAYAIRDSRSGRFTLGAAGMSKLNAIEGIKQSSDSRKMFAEFERNGASAEERRRAIMAKHAKKG